jgi:hypothetical protein
MVNKMKQALKRFSSGQALVEFTIMFPVLLIMLSGLMEFGFMMNEYLDVLDGAREAARFGADINPFTDSYADEEDYYRNVAILAEQTMAPVRICIDPPPAPPPLPAPQECEYQADRIIKGDVVISVFGVADTSSGMVVTRFPGGGITPTPGQWSKYGLENSEITTAEVIAMLDPGAPNTGIVIVEVFYHYDQKFRLPWITAFVPDPIRVRSHTIMPAVAAEPTPTPLP